MQIIKLLLILATLFWCASWADIDRPLSVCEVVSNRDKYRGEIVAVRGRVKGGGHGIFLAPDVECKYVLKTNGIVWPNIINLTLPNNHSKDPDVHAPFRPDWLSLRKADVYCSRQGYAANLDIEVATYIGLFVTYVNLADRVSPGVPGAPRLGFGPTGLGAPTQLVIRSVRDVTITKNAK